MLIRSCIEAININVKTIPLLKAQTSPILTTGLTHSIRNLKKHPGQYLIPKRRTKNHKIVAHDTGFNFVFTDPEKIRCFRALGEDAGTEVNNRKRTSSSRESLLAQLKVINSTFWLHQTRSTLQEKPSPFLQVVPSP